MRVGVPAEVKSDEYRVALTPAGALELSRRGHDVVVSTTPVPARASATRTSRASAPASATWPTRGRPTWC